MQSDNEPNLNSDRHKAIFDKFLCDY